MHPYKICIVAPVHIEVSAKWIEAVDSLGVDVIIVDDSDGNVFIPERWTRLDYAFQKKLLGERYGYWTKFQKSSACKNIGHLYAYQQGYDIIMGLDSDCIPGKDFVEQHVRNLEMPSYTWENPLSETPWFSRGFPYSQRNARTAFSLGLWHNELDLYGTDRVQNPKWRTKDPRCEGVKVAQTYIPLSGMNWAIWRENIPELLFLPNHADYRRHDDIWGGYIFQKAMFTSNERLVYGLPLVHHDTVVVPEEDAEEEVAMIRDEDEYFAWVDAGMPPDEKWDWVSEALSFWKSLYA